MSGIEDRKRAIQNCSVGDNVLKDGYLGKVVALSDWDKNLVVVRLGSGDVCVEKDTLTYITVWGTAI